VRDRKGTEGKGGGGSFVEGHDFRFSGCLVDFGNRDMLISRKKSNLEMSDCGKCKEWMIEKIFSNEQKRTPCFTYLKIVQP
jgi:hypothetical protein